MKLEFTRQIKKKKSGRIKFPENLPSGRRIVPCGHRDGGTDMTKLTVAFRSFANASKHADFNSYMQTAIRLCNKEHLVACPRVQAAGRLVQERCGVGLFCCWYLLRCD